MTSREQIREIVAAEPHLSLREIGDRLGISRERVRQIIASEGLVLIPPTPAPKWAARPRVITGGIPVPVSSSIVGTIGELLVAADLMARGYVVFYPFARAAACDLISLDYAGKTERIEVRCGYRSGERYIWRAADKSRSDRRAIVITGEPVKYRPRFEGDPPDDTAE